MPVRISGLVSSGNGRDGLNVSDDSDTTLEDVITQGNGRDGVHISGVDTSEEVGTSETDAASLPQQQQKRLGAKLKDFATDTTKQTISGIVVAGALLIIGLVFGLPI